MKTIVKFKDVIKEYKIGEQKVLAANKVNFEINEGEFVVILGPSGAGKSTVLNLLGGMDFATGGEIIIDGKDITKYNDDELTEYRAKNIGFVFQFYNLIPSLTTVENVELIKDIKNDILNPKEVLDWVGLKEHLNKFPTQLSGGEQQRVSIARAICKNPTLLLCDEPTGALDSETGILILSLLKKMCKKLNKTVIIVTHNAALKDAADKVIKIRNGKVTNVIINKKPVEINEVEW